jgi:hypothetical protein
MARLSEKDLSEIWRRQSFFGPLYAESGDPVTIIYPGRRNDNRGGDFCDAVIAFRGRTVAGDVELHVNSADWQRHGHHRDPAYNNVVLHVVHSHARSPTILQNGREIPVLALDRVLTQPDRARRRVREKVRPCWQEASALKEAGTGHPLDLFGEQRFTRKAAGFRFEISSSGPGQTLYQGIMRALGYSRNCGAFLELARRLPLWVLERVLSEGEPDEPSRRRIEMLLRHASGLEAPPPQSSEAAEFACYHLRAMSRSDWNNFRARPGNSPLSRMAAMSHLLVRYRAKGLVASLLGAVRYTGKDEDTGALRHALEVNPSAPNQAGSQASNGAGALASRETAALLGKDRANDIAVNVLLPFAHAVANNNAIATRALLIYRSWPRSGSNCIERHAMGQMGLDIKLIDTARRQQGLLEVHSSLCSKGQCAVCPLVPGC